MSLTQSELDDMRAAVLDLLPSTVNVLSVTRTSNGAGGFTEAWGTVTANVSCRLDFVNGSEGILGASRQPFAGYMLTMPYDTAITSDNRVEHGGLTYAVITDNADQSDLIVKRVQVQRV